MLKAMRKNIKSLAPTLWFVIIAFIISIFAVWGGAGRLGGNRGADVLAVVGGEKISAQLYYQTLRQRLEAMMREFKELDSPLIQQLNIPQQILNQLIQQSLLIQLARDMEIRATDEEIRKKIMSYPVFQKDGKFIGFSEYKRILEWNRIPLGEFERSLEQEIVMQKTVDVLTAGVAVDEDELWENYKRTNDTAKLEYVILDLEKINLDKEPQLSALQEYFETHKETYRIPEKREGDYVFLLTEDMKKDVEIKDSELKDYYEKNTARFKEPEKIRVSRIYLPFEGQEKETVLKEARKLLDRIQKGEDFGEAAKTHSKDEKAQDLGDWGYFEWKNLSSQEQEKIAELNAGEVSDILELEDGAVLLKVTEKEPETVQPFDAVQDRILSILKDQKARELAEKRITQLAKAARREKSLDAAAQKLGYEIKKAGLLASGDSIEDIDPSGSIAIALFSLQEKDISSPVYTYKGVGVVQLQKIEPSRPATFEEAREDVVRDFTAVKKREVAAQRLRDLKRQLKRGKTLEELAAKQGLEYKTVNEHRRGQYLAVIGENKEVDDLAFSLPPGETSDPVEWESGYVLVRVLERKEVTREEFEEKKDAERETYLEMEKNRFFASYLSKIMEEKNVKINNELFQKINTDVVSRFAGEAE